MIFSWEKEKFRLLLIEDNPGDIRLVQVYLSEAREDFELISAPSMTAALEKLAGQAFDIILADLSLPDGNGLDCVDRLLAAAPITPIIVLTGQADEAMALEALRRGCQDYLDKGALDVEPLRRSIRYSQARKEMELRVRDLTHDLEKAKEAAEEANLAKSQFLASMGQELRAPLSAILGFGQLLEQNPNEPLTTTQANCVAHILKSGQELLGLINDVLELANIEAGRVGVSLEKVKISTMLTDCRLPLSHMLNEAQISLVLPDEAPWRVKADHIRLKQVLSVLLASAVKYNRPVGKIEISCHEQDEDWLRVSIKDSGTSEDRTSVALATAQKLIELMGGRSGGASLDGKMEFWIELPLAEAVEDQYVQDAQAQSGSQAKPGSGVILYVEDNPVNLELMEMMIGRMAGLSLISATTAEQGIELAKERKPDLILLDINLPGMSGNEAAKILQSMPETSHIPLVALSAAATKADIERGMESGFLTYLTKPIRLETLSKMLGETLGKR
jgi:CheY-like chemotaxis protein